MANNPTSLPSEAAPRADQPAPPPSTSPTPDQDQLGNTYASGYQAGFAAASQACQQRTEALQQPIGGTECVTICGPSPDRSAAELDDSGS